MKFSELNLNKKLLSRLSNSGYVTMTAIQQSTYDTILSGKDMIGISKTGSGKTLAFLVPLLQKKRGRIIIIVPTRELAVQVHSVASTLFPECDLIIGGVKMEEIRGEILVCTVGRLLHHLESEDIEGVDTVVIDEADKMIEKGFKEQLENVLKYFNERQTLLFSATEGNIIEKVEIFGLKDYKIIRENYEDRTLKQYYYVLSMDKKINYLFSILKYYKENILVFFSTCKEVKFYYLLFKKLKFNVSMLNGGMKQSMRMESCKNFNNGGILFATDLGARGLDFSGVKLVLQFDIPESIETYVHRIGRTARNGKEGNSIIFLLKGEEKIIKEWKSGKWQKDKNVVSEIEEGKQFEVKKVERRVRSIMLMDDIKYFAQRYLITYKKFLTLQSKKYKTDVEKEIGRLKDYLGIIDISDIEDIEIENKDDGIIKRKGEDNYKSKDRKIKEERNYKSKDKKIKDEMPKNNIKLKFDSETEE